MKNYAVVSHSPFDKRPAIHGMTLAEYTLEYQDPAEFIHEYQNFIRHGGARLPSAVPAKDSDFFCLWIKPPMLKEPVGMHASVTSTGHGVCFVKLKPISSRERDILESYVHGYTSGQNWLAERKAVEGRAA